MSARGPVTERRTSVKSDADRTPILVMAVLAVLALCGTLAWLLTSVLARAEPGRRRPEAATGRVRRERNRAPRPRGDAGVTDETQRSIGAGRLSEPVRDPVRASVREECELEWFRGYVKSQFLAVANRPGDSFVRESPWFAWRGTTPPPQVGRIAAARDDLVEALLRDGWERSGVGEQWYSDRLQRTAYVGMDA